MDKESYTDWTEEPFVDVPQNAWYNEYVYASRHLFRGTSKTTFAPDTSLTRAMLVTVLLRHQNILDLGKTETGNTDGKFSDVSDGKWYSEAVAWAAENGIVNGYPDGTFRPNKEVTREEAVTVLGRYYKKNEPKQTIMNNIVFTYVPHADTDEISDWALEWILDGMSIGAVHYEKYNSAEDVPEYYFRPESSMTRAEAAKVAYAFLSDLEVSIERGYRVLPGGLTPKK